MSSLPEQLQILQSCGFKSDEDSLYEAQTQVKEIQLNCLRRLTKQELGLYCSLLFNKDGGILQILSKNVAKPQHKSVREEILSLLSTFVPRIGTRIDPYVDDVYGSCVIVFRSDRYAKNKIKSLQVLAELVSQRDISSFLREGQINSLVKMLFEEAASTKSTSTVKGESFHMLGMISRFYPEFMTNCSERLFEIFLNGLQKEMISSTKASDHKLIEGYLLGLNALLYQFTSSYDENPNRCKSILKFARLSMQPQSELTRFAVPLAGIKLLKNHAAQFGPLLIDDCELYYNTLFSWFEHKNPQLKHQSHAALDSFLQQVAGKIVEEDKPNDKSKHLFMFFIRKFKSLMNSPDTSNKLMSLVVKGYGLFAGACRLYLSKSDVRQMFTEVMGRSERMFLNGGNDVDDNKIHQLPSFIESLASIIKQLESDKEGLGGGPSESFMTSLCRMCVLMMEKYPRLHRKYHFFCHTCILAAIKAFSGTPDVRDLFLQKIIYQGLIRSCSYGVVLGEDRSKLDQSENSLLPSSARGEDLIDDVINDARTITYKDYIPLWSCLMSENKWSESTDFVDRSRFYENRRQLCQLFSSIFLKSVLQIASKLNLSANAENQDGDSPNTALVENLKAENAVDFKIFINLVDLCWDLLPSVMLYGTPASEAFTLYFQTLLQQLVVLSTRFPLVSGFYKLLATVVKISRTLTYFSVTGSDKMESQDSFTESMELSEENKLLVGFCVERQQSLVLLQKFAIEVVSRQKQYKDDLLASSLFFLLSLPSNVASAIIPQLTPAVQRAAVLGVSYFPLAEALLSALERWKEEYLKDRASLEFVITSLRPFLTPEKGQVSVIKEKVKAKKKSKSSIRAQKSIKEAEEPARKKIRSRIVRYLGSLGGSVLSFLKTPDDATSNAVAPWDKDIAIKYAIPFRDLKPEIRLDLYLPRVLEVASQSSDRHAKISACELLHSIVLYTIGTNAQTINMKSVTSLMPSLYKKLFPVLLNLACDVDQVCKQMFEPLMKQVIHWFTNNLQFENPSTVALLNSIMDGLIDVENASLRELSAQFLTEFLAWSIKQNTMSTTSSPTNAKSIFKRIYSLARHPSAGKRLGASVAFNHLYKVFREKDSMVDDYLLEILVTFIDCLALAHEDDTYIGTETSCIQSLKHIDRIVKAKFENLNKASKTRRIPKGFDPSKSFTLTSVVEWLFDQCGRPQTECRHQCMKFFFDFVKLIPDQKLRSATLWMNYKKSKEGIQYFTFKFENGNGNNGIQSYVYMSSLGAKFSVKTGCSWFDLVLAALEAYSWVFQEKLLTPSDVLQEKNNSCLFRSLRYFICDVAQKSLQEIASKLSKSRVQDQVFTPQDTDTYNKKKCALISRTIQFFTMLFQRFPDQAMRVIPEDFWTDGCILSLVLATVVSPARLGFDTLNDVNVVKNLHQLSTKIISLFLRFLPPATKKLFVELTAKTLTEIGSVLDSIPLPFGSNVVDDTTFSNDVINAYVILKECKMLEEISNFECSNKCPDVATMREEIFNSLFNAVVSKSGELESNPISLNPRQVEVGKMLLYLTFKLGLQSDFLVEKLYDNSKLVSYETESNMRNTHGQLFASTFSTTINEEICDDPSKYIPAIIRRSRSNLTTCTHIITSLLEYLATNGIARRNKSSAVCSSIFEQWESMKIFWHEDSSLKDETTQSNSLDILRRLFTLDVKVCTEPNHSSFESVFEMYSHMLSSPKLNLAFKLQALDLLSFFTLAQSHTEQLKISIESLVAKHFPLSSKEFAVGSTSFNEYNSAVGKLLSCLEMTGNLMILQIVVNIFCREEGHVMSDQIRETFLNCVKRIAIPRQKDALDIPFKIFTQSRSPAARRHAVCDAIVPMATQCDVISLIEFFANHVTEIMAVVKEDTKRFPETQWTDQLEKKSLSYRLLELMFSILPKDHIDVNSAIGQAYSGKEGKESLMKSFMMKATRDRNENLEGESVLLEERRKFHCSVYNAMIASVICTQTDQKWYKAFLLDENPSKNQFLLNNVMATKEKYIFEVEISEPLVKRKRFVAIRKAKQDEDEDNDDVMFAPYMASVAGSSLSEEVSAFDENRARTIQISSLQSETDLNSSSSTSGSSSKKGGRFQGNFIELEANSLNQHECMPAMVGLITHMHHNNIGFPSGDSPGGELPSWMTSLLRKFSSSSTHPNIRLFIAKLIVNCEAVFRPFAKHWIPPLIQTITRGDCGLDGIDWMTCDIVATALSWNSVAIPEDNVEGSGLVQGLIEHLAEKFPSENRSLMRHNLDLIKATLECWGSRIKSGINPKLVYDLCGSADVESKSNFAGLQLLGALLANGVSPYTQSYVVDRKDYFKRVFRNILYKRKEIYDSASEVAGMTLKYLTQVCKETEGEIHDLVASNLLSLAKDPKRQDVFITSLHKVASHHPPFVDQFLARIMYLASKVHGDLLTYCFEIVHQRANSIEDLFAQLKAKNFTSKLGIGNEALQLVCLRLCYSLVTNKDSQLSDNDVMLFFAEIAKHFVQHPSAICRQEAANVAMELYDRQARFLAEERSSEIESSSRIFLLKMLNDPEEALRTQVANFWSSEERLPVQACSKLGSLLGQLYDPGLDEVKYITNTVSLLLQSASLSPDFERPLFDHPLSECVFQEYTIDNRWRYRHSSMTPLFADTLQASGSGGSPQQLGSPGQPNLVMATQEQLQFSATVDVTGKNTYNWMTGSSLDTFSSLAVFAQPERKSPLLVSSGASGGVYRPVPSTQKPSGPDFGSRRLVYAGNDKFGNQKGSGVDVDVERLRRRFRKESDDSRMRFARAHERRNKLEEAAKKDSVKRRESEVQLHRKYRTGELPDVQIPHRSVVAPLAAACQHDARLSRIVLSSLILSVVEEEAKTDKKNSSERVNVVVKALGEILERSTEKTPALIGCIQEVCYHDNRVTKVLTSNIVASSSLASNNRALGIMLLEEMILKDRDDEPSTKRQKITKSTFQSSPETWLQLARLYKSVGDYDVLSGIFGEGSDSNHTTYQGMSLEAQSCHKEARKIYEKALNDDDADASEVEKDLWEDCLLNCLKQMSRWDHVNQMCDSMLDRHDDDASADDVTMELKRAWSYPDFQDRYLDSSVHSKLLMLLQGRLEVGDQLSAFFDDAMQGDTDKKTFVERNYSEQLTMLYLYKGDYNRARYYLDKTAEHATQRWSSAGNIGRKGEQEITRIVPLVSDLCDFLDFAQKPDDDVSSGDVRKIVTGWMTRMPHLTYDPITSWHDVLSYRPFLMERMNDRIDSLLNDFMDMEGSKDSWMSGCRNKMLIEMMRSAGLCQNFVVADKIRKALEREYEEMSEEIKFKLSHATASLYHTQGRHLSDKSNTERGVMCNLAAYRSLQELSPPPGSSDAVNHYLLLATTYAMTSRSLVLGCSDEVRMEIADAVGEGGGNLEQRLLEYAQNFYEKAVKDSAKCDEELQFEAYTCLASFCDKQIRKSEEEQATVSVPAAAQHAVTMTTCLLRAMKLRASGRSLATMRFPRLLQLLEMYGKDMKPGFLREVTSVPSWTFLPWLGHAVALLDSKVAPFLHPIVTQVARDYPQALVYPLCAAQDGFSYQRTEEGKRNKTFVKRLLSSLHQAIPLANEFIRQLQQVSDPAVLFKDWCSDFTKLQKSKKDKKINASELLVSYQNMYKELFDHDQPCDDVSEGSSSLYGSATSQSPRAVGALRTKFAEDFKSDVDELFGGSAGNALLQMKNLKKLSELRDKIAKFGGRAKTLRDYSPWLADYQNVQRSDKDLEIPGQYHGRSRPLMEYHVTVVGFDERVQVMSSLRKPCRIIIRGSDEKDYSFLVKGGEDLRQDQRIEQLFVSVNDIFKDNPSCRDAGFNMITYQVIPINSKVGLIEWLPNVVPFLDLMEKQAAKMGCETLIGDLRCSKWVPNRISQVARNRIEEYGFLMQKASYTDVVEKFNEVQNRLPWNMLREVYIRMSSDPESFLLLRKRFIASYGVMCIVHWILGIGDRHPSNFMVSMTTGRAVGIDFGHAFGSATEVLPVAELVPFRMTRQLTCLLQPHAVKRGEMRQVMVRCLSAIRSRMDEFLPLLDVFVKDPSVDWSSFAKKSRDTEQPDAGDVVRDVTSDRAWYARRKMKIVDRKLRGGNPAAITCDELSHNADITRYQKYYCLVAKGDCAHDNVRAELGGDGLSVDEQVDCLLDQATDPNILGRCYYGWKSWL